MKVFWEGRGYVVTTNVKFPVRRMTRKAAYDEYQRHGYEVDIVAARANRLVLASVKSYFGSQGVHPQGFRGLADETKGTHFGRYTLFNDAVIRERVIAAAAAQYGYKPHQVRVALCAGKFAIKDGSGERAIRAHLGALQGAGGPVEVYNLDELVAGVLQASAGSTYIDDPVVMTVKALSASRHLRTG